MVSVRNAILICIFTRLVSDAFYYLSDVLDDGDTNPFMDRHKTMCEELLKETEEMFPINEFDDAVQKCWCYFHDDGPKIASHDVFKELLEYIRNKPDLSMTQKLWIEFKEVLDLHMTLYIDRAIVLCVMLGLNRDFFQSLFHVGLIILSLLYDPVVAIGVYGYMVLTPNQDEHVA